MTTPELEDVTVVARPVEVPKTNNSRQYSPLHEAERRRGVLAAIFILVFGAYLAIVVPPFQVVDEDEHFKRAYLLAEGEIILGTRQGSSTGGLVDKGLLLFIEEFLHYRGNPNARLTQEQWVRASEISWDGRETYTIAPGTGYYMPIIYIPQALGLTIGRALDATISQSYMLAKFLTLLASCASLIVAFRMVAPPAPVLAVLLMPMTVYQAGSVAIDHLSFSATILALSIFINNSASRNRMSFLGLVSFALVILTVATCRLQMGVLILLPAFLYFQYRDRRLLVCFALVGLATAAWYLVSIANTVDLRRSGDTPPFEILRFYVAQPAQLLAVIWNTLLEPSYRKVFIESFIGKLGWWDTTHPAIAYFAVSLLMIWTCLLSIKRPTEGYLLTVRLPFFGLCLLSAALVFFSMIIAWTPHPAEVVEGVQGRYFIPPVILLFYALYWSDGSRVNPVSEKISSIVLIFLACVTIYWIINFVANRYYFSGIFLY